MSIVTLQEIAQNPAILADIMCGNLRIFFNM